MSAGPAARRTSVYGLWKSSPSTPLNAALCYRAAMEFSTGSAIRFGWETFKRRPWFFVGSSFVILLVYGVVGAFASAIDAAVSGSPDDPSLPGTLVNFALGTLVSMGVTAFYLAAHDNPDTVELSSLWHPRPFWKFLGASILLGLTIAIGFVLLIVPGIIFSLMFLFTTFIVIERELGPIEAMKESSRITRGHKWPLLGFVIVLTLINVLGVLALVVGLLVSIPVSTLAFVHAYRVLSAKAGAHPAVGTSGTTKSRTCFPKPGLDSGPTMAFVPLYPRRLTPLLPMVKICAAGTPLAR